jgi:hypothetical protein
VREGAAATAGCCSAASAPARRHQQLELAREAERLGATQLGGRAYGSDTATVLVWLAAQISAIGLARVPACSPGQDGGHPGQ